jgi:hypothetical protein
MTPHLEFWPASDPRARTDWVCPNCTEAAAEIDRLNKCLHYEQHLATHIGTHGPGCHEWGQQHYECLKAEAARWRDVALLQHQALLAVNLARMSDEEQHWLKATKLTDKALARYKQESDHDA